MFLRVRERGDSSLISIGVSVGPLFPLSWTLDPRIIKGVNPSILPPDQEVIQILKCFWTLDSCILITRDHEDGNGVIDNLGVLYGMKEYILI